MTMPCSITGWSCTMPSTLGSARRARRFIAPTCPRSNHDPGQAANPRTGVLWGSILVLAQARLRQFRRTDRTNRDDAPGSGGAAALAPGESPPASIQLLLGFPLLRRL